MEQMSDNQENLKENLTPETPVKRASYDEFQLGIIHAQQTRRIEELEKGIEAHKEEYNKSLELLTSQLKDELSAKYGLKEKRSNEEVGKEFLDTMKKIKENYGSQESREYLRDPLNAAAFFFWDIGVCKSFEDWSVLRQTRLSGEKINLDDILSVFNYTQTVQQNKPFKELKEEDFGNLDTENLKFF